MKKHSLLVRLVVVLILVFASTNTNAIEVNHQNRVSKTDECPCARETSCGCALQVVEIVPSFGPPKRESKLHNPIDPEPINCKQETCTEVEYTVQSSEHKSAHGHGHIANGVLAKSERLRKVLEKILHKAVDNSVKRVIENQELQTSVGPETPAALKQAQRKEQEMQNDHQEATKRTAQVVAKAVSDSIVDVLNTEFDKLRAQQQHRWEAQEQQRAAQTSVLDEQKLKLVQNELNKKLAGLQQKQEQITSGEQAMEQKEQKLEQVSSTPPNTSEKASEKQVKK